jgi:hypothetical protein
MNQHNKDKQVSGYPPQIIETAFTIWEAMEKLSATLWNTFSDQFIEFDEQRTMIREQRRCDAEDDLPF